MARAKPSEQGHERAGLPLATDYRTVRGMTESLGAHLGVRGEKAVSARLSDPAWIAAQLGACSAKGLAILELLVDAGGALRKPALGARAKAALALEEGPLERELQELSARSLAMSLHLEGVRNVSSWVSLHAASSSAIAARVGGLSLPPAPPAATPAGRASGLRDRLARLAATAHVPIRANVGGQSHLTSAKQYGKALGVDPYEAAGMLDAAAERGLLVIEGGRLVPALGALRAAASGASGWDDLDAWARAHAPEDRWTSVEALARAFARSRHVEANRYGFDARGVLTVDPPEVSGVRASLASSPGLESLEHEGATFVRRASAGARASGDGHVTPSFEIMLGPECSPALALELALAAEPVRIDRVLTLKLTPASVAAACALGLSAEEIVAALGRVGRHGVPDNVRAMVLEWARSARVATARKAWVIECSTAEAAEAAARALGASVIARPSPTIVLASESLASPAAALGKAGVSVRGSGGTGGAGAPARPAVTIPIEPLFTEPSPELVARLRSGAAGASLGTEDDDRVDPPSAVLRALAAQPRNAGPARAALLLAAELWRPFEGAFLAWAHALGTSAGSLALELSSRSPLAFAELVALPPSARQRVLARSTSAPGVIEAAHHEGAKGYTRDGDELLRSLRTRAVRDVLERHLAEALGWLGEAAPTPAGRGSGAEPAKGAKPRPTDLGTMRADEVLAAFERAIGSASEVWLRVSSKSQGERAVRLRAERVLVRGTETTLLGTEMETDLGRSFPLPNVVSLRPAQA